MLAKSFLQPSGCLLVFLGLMARAAAPAASLAAPADGKVYAGSSLCRECHEAFYQLWAPSHHGLAMQPYALARTNLVEQKTPLEIGTNAYQADVAKGVVLERGAGAERPYALALALGGKNVFYFLTPRERGRLQVLPVGYDLRRKEWFDVARSAVRHFARQPDEPLHWTESPYTFNTACFSCHVSQLTNHYRLETDTYQTSWAEPGINCETCHGPAAEHVRAARQTPQGRPLKDLKLLSLGTVSPEQMNSLCGACHAKLYPLTSSFSPGDRFFDHFGLAALEQADFYPDGRELGEDFTFTSWRLSPCLKSGKLHCAVCHTASGRYRFPGARADAACLPCHQDKVNHAAAHSRHQAGTEGARCVACHMPTTEFARMRRTDHSMRPPMPAATLACGSPNACNLCHTNQTAAWADREVRQWHPRDYQAATLQRAGWVAAARKRDWSRLPEIVNYLGGPGREEIWAASLLRLLAGCEQEAKWEGIRPCLKDPSPLVRAAAAQALGEGLRPEFIAPLVAATRDDFRLVRLCAANALAGVPQAMLPGQDRPAVSKATDELLASFLARPDDAGSYHNLGNFRLERHEYGAAIAAFTTASRLQPRDISPLVNLSVACNLAGQNDQAEASLRQALRLDPTNAAIQLNLGMLLAEMERPAEAEAAFRAAFNHDPKSAPAAFNLGVLLSKDHPAEALTWCRRAAELRPQEPKYAYTLAFYQYQQGLTAQAAQTLEKLVQQDPPAADAYALLGRIYEQRSQPDRALSLYRRAVQNTKLPEPDRAQFAERIRWLSPHSAAP
ncbi:MAG: tetratricopeptide repeat protein [Verrucomicrobiota bacterium]